MAARKTKNISLTPRLEKYVARKVASGRYQSASEVVREAIRIMEQHEKDREQALDEVRRKVAHGLGQARRGELVDGEEAMERILAKLRKRAAQPRRRRAG